MSALAPDSSPRASTRFRWWSQPCGGREVVALALPLVISTASWTLMHFIDRIFLLWHSEAELAAAMPAGMLNFTMLCLPFGMAGYLNTFVAQYDGANRPRRIGAAVWQGVWLGIAAAPLFISLGPFGKAIFSLAGHEPQLVDLEATYFRIMTFAAGGAVISCALSTFFTGRGETRVVMLVNIASAVLNVVLNFAWVFGRWGFPEMGIAGAGWATVASMWLKVLAYGALMLQSDYRRQFGTLSGWRPDGTIMRRLLWYGGPNGLQMFVDATAFTVFIMLVGRLGELELAVTTLAFSVNMLAFVPMLGLGLAVSTLVGRQIGRQRPDLAARATWTAFGLALLYMGTMATLYVAVPDLFLWGYAAGTEASEFARLRPLTIILLRYVAAYCLFDAMIVVFMSAIKGAGDTRFILITTCFVAPLPVLIGWLGRKYFGGGLLWFWLVITVWLIFVGLIYLARFLQGRWRTMSVIEPEMSQSVVPTLEEPALAGKEPSIGTAL